MKSGLYIVVVCGFYCAEAPVRGFNGRGLNSMTSKVQQMHFGQLADGSPISKYIITNQNKMSCELMEYGACVIKLTVPDRNGTLDDVTLGFNALSDYEQRNNAYFGVTVGRVCNRIANGQFKLNGKEFQLDCNNGCHHLHGGFEGFSKKRWLGSIVSDSSVNFHLDSSHGDQGYPGALAVDVTYTLLPSNEISIQAKAIVQDRPTLVSITNHTYFNLHGLKSQNTTVLDHQLFINATTYTPTNDTCIPLGIRRTVTEDDGVYDFLQAKAIGSQIAATSNGYDHNFCLNHGSMSCAARLFEKMTGRLLEITTDQPGVQLYTGNYLDNVIGKSGRCYAAHSGVCLETQAFPNAINEEGFDSPILLPGQQYNTVTTWKFQTK